MSKTSVAAFITTNMDKRSINDGFLNAASVQLANLLHTTDEYVNVEFQTGVTMMRGGSSAPMLNIRLFHNSDVIDVYNKGEKAEGLAAWLAREIRVPKDRYGGVLKFYALFNVIVPLGKALYPAYLTRLRCE